MKLLKILSLVSLLLCLTACTQVPQWTLFYAADGQTLDDAKLSEHIAGYYEQVDQCLAKGAGMVKLSETGQGSYQCGYLCQLDDKEQLVCQRFQSMVNQ